MPGTVCALGMNRPGKSSELQSPIAAPNTRQPAPTGTRPERSSRTAGQRSVTGLKDSPTSSASAVDLCQFYPSEGGVLDSNLRYG
jgi:hypothetical protein